MSTGYDPPSDVASGHFGGGSNYDDEHVPVPAAHSPTRHEFQVGRGEGAWFVVGEGSDLDECTRTQAYVEATVESLVSVEQ